MILAYSESVEKCKECFLHDMNFSAIHYFYYYYWYIRNEYPQNFLKQMSCLKLFISLQFYVYMNIRVVVTKLFTILENADIQDNIHYIEVLIWIKIFLKLAC